jgi:hypothetical protein
MSFEHKIGPQGGSVSTGFNIYIVIWQKTQTSSISAGIISSSSLSTGSRLLWRCDGNTPVWEMYDELVPVSVELDFAGRGSTLKISSLP